jgi:lipopolysaccharide/colanic/teichoic acid biosynthesis glycosyltransferase
VTDLGRILRATHLDELPQLWCILKGEMSLVGPRPEREVYYNEFEKYIHGFHERLKVKPGLTGLAQVEGGYYLAPQKKAMYDVEYIKNRSIWMDIKIILKTAVLVFDYDGGK